MYRWEYLLIAYVGLVFRFLVLVIILLLIIFLDDCRSTRVYAAESNRHSTLSNDKKHKLWTNQRPCDFCLDFRSNLECSTILCITGKTYLTLQLLNPEINPTELYEEYAKHRSTLKISQSLSNLKEKYFFFLIRTYLGVAVSVPRHI